MSKLKGDLAPKPEEIVFDDFLVDPLAIPKSIPKEHREKYAFRWIDWKGFENNGGAHNRGWVPYKLPEKLRNEFSHPTGYIRKGTVVLGHRPMELHERHKAYNKKRALGADPTRAARKRTEELKSAVKSEGLSKHVSIQEGYEDE